MKKLRMFIALLLCLALVAAPMTVLADGEDTVTLNLSNGCIVITPTGYSQNDGDEVPFTGSYIITGSLKGDTPLRIMNTTDAAATINITLVNASIIAGTWCTAVVLTGSSPITLNLTNQGASVIKAYNHPALALHTYDGEYTEVTVNITNPEGSSLYLDREYLYQNSGIVFSENAPIGVTINGEPVDNSKPYGSLAYGITTVGCAAYDAGGNVITSAKSGDTVTIVPNAPSEGQFFVKWSGDYSSYSEDPVTHKLTFRMPQKSVSFTADVRGQEGFRISLTGGTAYDEAGNSITTARPGDMVTVVADAAGEGEAFAWWETTNVSSINHESATASFTMPYDDVELTAIYATHISAITVTFDEPVVGAVPGAVQYVTDPENVLMGELKWYCLELDESGEIVDGWTMEEDETFQAGYMYELDLGYDLDMADPSQVVLANEDTVIRFNGKEGILDYDYDIPVVYRTEVLRYTYSVVEGAESEITKSSGETLRVLVDARQDTLADVLVDGEPLEEAACTVDPETGAITISTEYLDTLESGEHELKLVYDIGDAQTTFTVKSPVDPDGPAATGDAIRPVMAMLAASAMALLGMAVAKKRFSL